MRRPPVDSKSAELDPPPGEGPMRRARRWWRSRGQHEPFGFWWWFRASPILAAGAGLYCATGLLSGHWEETYLVFRGAMPPSEAPPGWLSYPLALVGWLLVPTLVGVAAGHVVTRSLGRRRRTPVGELFGETDDG